MIRLLAILALLIDACAESYDLLVLAGQSNAQGWTGDASHYPQDSKQLDRDIPLYFEFPRMNSSGGKWMTLGPQPGRFPKGHFGPEISLARRLKSQGYTPAIFKFTLSGSSLDKNWKAPNEGGLYDKMTRSLQQSIESLRRDGHRVRIRALIWIQGETDAVDPGSAARYEDNLSELITHFRTRVARQRNLPVILGIDELNPFVIRRPIVVVAQKNIAARDQNISWTSMKGLPKRDQTHLKPSGLIRHGNRLAAAFLELLER